MNRCPITYELCGTAKYSEKGLKMIATKLTHLNDLPYTAAELRQEAANRAKKLSIQLNIKEIAESKIQSLKALLQMHPGNQALHFVIYDNAEQIKLQMPSRRQKVKVSQELLDALDEKQVFYKLN